MKARFFWNDYKYFPYERELAIREVEILFGTDATRCEEFIEANVRAGWQNPAKQLTYFKEVKVGTESIVPIQARLEGQDSTVSTRQYKKRKTQSTRYSAHGLHEYRGKFNPQIVRAIGNLLQIRDSANVFDPFCGSGTTLLSGMFMGWNVVGIDRNPLAVFIANAKIYAVSSIDNGLWVDYKLLTYKIGTLDKKLDFDKPFDEEDKQILGVLCWSDILPNNEYLSNWFTESILLQLAFLLNLIDQIERESSRQIFKVILSDIVREVSLQDPRDLRIRRRKKYSKNLNVLQKFIDSSKKKLETIQETKSLLKSQTSRSLALQSDAKEIINGFTAEIPETQQLFDAAITSPPYATGLPYVDTNRLSLVLLGLIDASEIKTTQTSLIGNREITKKERLKLFEDLRYNKASMPTDVHNFCMELVNALDSRDGFRRQNTPALLYKYFDEMAMSFRGVKKLLKPNSPYALVVGKNRTTLGGKEFVINTPELLAKIATTCGFKVNELIRLDTYPRYDLHKANSITAETLIILKAQ